MFDYTVSVRAPAGNRWPYQFRITWGGYHTRSVYKGVWEWGGGSARPWILPGGGSATPRPEGRGAGKECLPDLGKAGLCTGQGNRLVVVVLKGGSLGNNCSDLSENKERPSLSLILLLVYQLAAPSGRQGLASCGPEQGGDVGRVDLAGQWPHATYIVTDAPIQQDLGVTNALQVSIEVSYGILLKPWGYQGWGRGRNQSFHSNNIFHRAAGLHLNEVQLINSFFYESWFLCM